MPAWWKRQTATVDAFVAGGITLCFCWWFGQLLQLRGTVALYAAVFGAFQLMRFVGAQLAELQWVRMHEAVLREKKAPAPPTPGDGYREAAIVEEPPPDADEEQLEHEVRTRGRRAKMSLGVVGALAWALSALPLLFGAPWGAFVFGATTFAALMTAISATALHAWRKQEAKRRDYFTRHLERDTQAILEPKPRVRVEDAHLRAGVDFGVPAEQLDGGEENAEANAEANERAAR